MSCEKCPYRGRPKVPSEGDPPKKKHTEDYFWDPPSEEWLRYQYLTLGKSIKTIAKEVGSGQGTIRRWLEAANVSRQVVGGAPKKFGAGRSISWTPPSKNWLEDQYLTLKKSAMAIAHEIGANGSTVRRWLRGFKIPKRSFDVVHEHIGRTMIGKENPRWKGGHSAGYILDQALGELEAAGVPEQCNLCGTTEAKLDVHHKDKDRLNNYLENLEYLCRSCHRNQHLQEEANV